MPGNIVVLYLPPYSPELKPVENLWGFMRSHYLSNRALDGYDHLLQTGTDAYRALSPELLRSVCRCPYLKRGS